MTAIRRTASGATLHVVPSAPPGSSPEEVARRRREQGAMRVPGLEPLARVGAHLFQVSVVAVYGVDGARGELLSAVGSAVGVGALRPSCDVDVDRLNGGVIQGRRVDASSSADVPADTLRFAPVTAVSVPVLTSDGALRGVAWLLAEKARPDLEGAPRDALLEWARAVAAILETAGPNAASGPRAGAGDGSGPVASLPQDSWLGEASLTALLATPSVAVVVTDDEGRIRRFNERAQNRYAGTLARGVALDKLLAPSSASALRATLESGGGRDVEERGTGSGQVQIWRTTFQPLTDQHGTRTGLIVLGVDATVLRPDPGGGADISLPAGPAATSTPQLDPLTGLPNRALAERRLDRDVADARRSGSRVAVAMIALDRFKRVNDSLGHAQGDALLRQVGERISSCTVEGDTVARLGGDEFLVILAGVGADRPALPQVHRIHQAVQETFHVNGNELVVSATVGVACFPDDAEDGATLRQYADIALHRAKERGRGRIERFEASMQTSAEDRLRIERELRRALGDRHFVLHYQPKYALADGRMTGTEALIRWVHPDRGIVSPGQFIPVAEETGLILPIGTWSLVEACKQRRIWRDLGLSMGGVAVNVAAPQFTRRDFVGTVERALRTSGLEPAQLELEVTESMLMDDVRGAAERLSELRTIGVKVSVDDFGTGYSSLAYLQRLPVDVLKIDRTFVKDLDADGTDGQQARVLAQAITGLGHSLGLRVVAEGVETPAQLAVLREFACDEAQGFLFARPSPAEAIGDGVPMPLLPAERQWFNPEDRHR